MENKIMVKGDANETVDKDNYQLYLEENNGLFCNKLMYSSENLL